MKSKAVLKWVGASADIWTKMGMCNHHPMQTDTPLQMMNSAVPATMQSAAERLQIAAIKGCLRGTFRFALRYATPSEWTSPFFPVSTSVV